MTSNEIRKRFLQFFEKRGHVIIPSASLVPESDSGVLFNTAGMQSLIPYLLGKEHPMGKRLVNSQKCVRTQDIEAVGDNTHDTFFEMLGNWSLGDPARTTDGVQSGGYFKKEAIDWSYEFLTSKEEGLGLDPQRIFVTCFEGDNPSTPESLRTGAPRDTESAEIWQEIFQKNNVIGERIYFRPADKNWWSVGDDGPCGPDTEMFYDLIGDKLSGMTLAEYLKADNDQTIVEIWNDVFMEYLKKDGKVVGKLEKKNVDTGAGLERVVMAVQGKTNIFDTDLFSILIDHIRKNTGVKSIVSERIIADHIRTSVFMIADGVLPSNTERGYILRRLIRRAVRHADILGLAKDFLPTLVSLVVKVYEEVYEEINSQELKIVEEIKKESDKFQKTLAGGLKQFEKIASRDISGEEAFVLFSTYGFPVEMTEELAKQKNISVDTAGFKDEMQKHKDLSRAGAEEKFKGNLSV